MDKRIKPKVTKIKTGWAVLSDWWAVHAPTREEAVERFHETAQKYSEILARPEPPSREGGDGRGF